MGSTLAKILLEIPESYRYLLDYKLAFVSIYEHMDVKENPVPIISLSFLRVDKNEQRAD